VLFDPATIIDRGTFDDPKRAPEGIRAVFVNGAKALDGGKVTGVRTGRVLRRS
jgi:N-acyl-D-amino-acid deacylase